MGLELNLSVFVVILTIYKCHCWIPKYEYNSLFEGNGLFSELGNSVDYQFQTTPEYGFWYQPIQFQPDDSSVYKKILENQLRAFTIISSLENDIPCEIRYTRGSFCSNLVSKEIDFADYPHVKALALLQWKRLRNSLDTHKLGSLRIDSPFYRV